VCRESSREASRESNRESSRESSREAFGSTFDMAPERCSRCAYRPINQVGYYGKEPTGGGVNRVE